MNKIILIIIFNLVFCVANAQTSVNFKKKLSIEHTYGDESYTSEKMEFEIHNGEVYGRITNPDTDALLNSKRKLSKNEINILSAFLKLVDEFKNDCTEEVSSSYIRYYTINKDGKEIKISKFCDWKNLTYFDIKQKLFETYLNNLKKEKQKLNTELSKLLLGNWTESIKFDKLDNKLICTIKKASNNFKASEYIEFKENYKMIAHRNHKIIYYQYKIDFFNGKKYLNIFADRGKNGEEFIYGHNFLITSLSEDEIKFTRF